MTVSEPAQLGTLIRRLRLANGLSQEQLAERCGLSARAVSDLERGQRSRPRPDTLRMLAEGLALGNEDREALLHAARPDLRPSPTVSSTAHAPGNGLPVRQTTLIGRDREGTELLTLLSGNDTRVTTLTGPGGVGKTRLALEAAHLAAPSFADGAVFVDLSPVSDPNLVASTIAQALGIHESGEHSIHDALRLALRDRRLLLLLDNFEQVIDAAPVVAKLPASAPELRVLVTSREALRVHGEHEVVIEPLELPDLSDSSDAASVAESPAVALFAATAQAANPGFALTGDTAPAVAEICRRLDGLPLAIELAASRVKHFPPATLLDHLNRRLPVLTGGPRDLPARQQTLRDTIAWSYDLLTADEQALFRRIGAFPGGASLAALDTFATIAGALELDLLSGLASLVDKSLLRERMGTGEMPRFSMLETIREFAGEMVVQAGELESSRKAIVAWALEFLSSGKGADLIYLLGLANLQRVDEEIDNVRLGFEIVVEQGDAESSARLFDGINDFLYVRGQLREAAAMGKQVLELAETSPIPDQLRGRTLTDLSGVWLLLFDPAEAEQLAREGLALTQSASDDAIHTIGAFHSVVMAVRDQGRYAEALMYAEQNDALASIPAGESYLALTKYAIGRLSYLLDDQHRAVEYLRESMDRSLAFGANEFAVYSGQYLAAAHLRRGERIEAAATLRLVVRLWEESGGSATGRLFLVAAAALAAASQRPEVAATLFAADQAQAALFGMRGDSDPWMIEAKQAVQAHFGEEAFEAAYREGQALSLEAAIALVLELVDQIEQGSPL